MVMISQDGDVDVSGFSLDSVDGMEIISSGNASGRTHYKVNMPFKSKKLYVIIKATHLENFSR